MAFEVTWPHTRQANVASANSASVGWRFVTTCDDKTQLQRLMERDQLGREASRARIKAQLPTRRKLDLADHIVNTDGSLDDTRKRTEALWHTLVDEAEKLYKKRDPHRIKW